MMNPANQKLHWNKLHQNKSLEKYSYQPTNFAKEVIKLFPNNANILELGCGLGNDAIFFAQNGHFVLATDVSDEVIRQNQFRRDNPNLNFKVMDISKKFPKHDAEFNVVYARLSLHYFFDSVTKKIFKEISRVLKPNGILCFMCRSTNDPLCGQGQRIEKDMFIDKEHIRHFFDKDYTKECSYENFKIEKIKSVHGDLYGKESGYLKVVARKL